MTRRYFVSQLPTRGGLVSLPAEEAEHATRVMRVQVGDLAELFDGQGQQASAQFIQVDRKACVCQSDASVFLPKMPKPIVEIAVAFPKYDRARRLVECLTELGIAKIIPLQTEFQDRSKAKFRGDKYAKVGLEACKQSGRNCLPQITNPISANDFFEHQSSSDAIFRFIADPSGKPAAQQMQPDSAHDHVVIAIGPEGGFSSRELALAEKTGFNAVSFGDRIYRIETAAIVAATLAIHSIA